MKRPARLGRLVPVVFSNVLLATVFLIGPGVTAPASAAATPKIMVVGDSISQGLEGDYTWRYRLAESLSSRGQAADFVGPWSGTLVTNQTKSHNGAYRPGISFDSANLAQWGWQVHQAKDVIGENVATYAPDYLLIELGFNDIAWGVNGPAGVLQDLEWLIYNAREKNPYVKILVANVPQRTALSNLPELPGLISDYNARLRARVPALNNAISPVTFVDIDGPLDAATHSYDGLHPNVRGEFVIAKAFADALAGHGVGKPFGALPASYPSNLTPAAPASITAVRSGEDIKISWPHVFAAGGYAFYSRDVTAGKPFERGVYDISTNTWTASLLPAGHKMEFYVRTTRGTYTSSSQSPTASAVVAPLPPVTNVKATVDPNKPYAVKLTWDAVSGAKDYSVYAAPGCGDVLPPERSAYTLQKWGLGNTTTWTQEYVFDDCVNYVVLASRNGGEGEWSLVSSARARPYEGNYLHGVARSRYFDTEPDQVGVVKDQKAETRVAAGEDRGIVVARGYIRGKDAETNSIGDGRQWDSNPYASSKIGVAWDTATGEIGVYAHRSCAVGGYPLLNIAAGCRSALPIKFVADASIYKDSDKSRYTYVSVQRQSSGGLRATVSAMNSWEGFGPSQFEVDFGRINATFVLTPSGATYRATLTGDRFPAWEFYRYARTEPAPLGERGVARTIGTRDQTAKGDLKGSPSTCVSPAAEKGLEAPPHPMAC
ncbi:SGNH/GDSL hydrolase family protein [Aeromicrobium choanae]|uniref:Lysophospholipase L1 n=1 Tax=Aeromicrobium choanae TaxID=1736691 RepID=A0A1T4Z641_9ACTN|nr:SGNH/GDSL hydrolase family protein [Aeromicrobium choanae]SKB09343.1 Lysophospholipase L1 [Aeromicrobium choanae]